MREPLPSDGPDYHAEHAAYRDQLRREAAETLEAHLIEVLKSKTRLIDEDGYSFFRVYTEEQTIEFLLPSIDAHVQRAYQRGYEDGRRACTTPPI